MPASTVDGTTLLMTFLKYYGNRRLFDTTGKIPTGRLEYGTCLHTTGAKMHTTGIRIHLLCGKIPNIISLHFKVIEYR